MKKSYFIIGGIVILLFLLVGIWYFFIRTSDNPVAQTINNVLPFGDGGENLPFSVTDKDPNNPFGTDSAGRPIAKLFQVSSLPVAGAVGIIKDGETIIRYTERGTGHIIDADPDTLAKVKISNTTMPKIYEALWTPDGNSVLHRTTRAGSEEIENTLVKIIPVGTSTREYKIETTLLRGDKGDTVVRNTSLGYVLRDSGVIATSALDGSNQSVLFASAFTDWNLFSTDTTLVALTKPSAQVSGFAYTVSSQGLTKLLGPLNGLMILPSPIGGRYLFSRISGSVLSLTATNFNEGSSVEIFPATFPEKCVWSKKITSILYCGSPEGGIKPNEPDNWYQGISHYSDSIWRFDTQTNFSDVLNEPKKNFDVDIDVEEPILTPDEDYLIFRNRNDLSLWALKLEIIQ